MDRRSLSGWATNSYCPRCAVYRATEAGRLLAHDPLEHRVWASTKGRGGKSGLGDRHYVIPGGSCLRASRRRHRLRESQNFVLATVEHADSRLM